MANRHILAPLAKCMSCACGCVGRCHTPHCTPHTQKLKALTFFKPDMVQYVFSYKTIYVSIEIPMQTHTYVHITQDMSTHKVDCPMEIVTLDKGNC